MDLLKCEAGFVVEDSDESDCWVKFFDNSKGLITKWEWNFGDGTFSYEKNPEKVYVSEGIYNVCLTITTLHDCEDQFCKPIWVFKEASPELEAAYITSTTETENVYEFNDASIGDIISWQWSFGDGSFSSEQNPTHEFTEEGLYYICLKIINSNGDSDTFCKSILIDNIFRTDTVLYELSGKITADIYTLPIGVIVLFKEMNDNQLIASQITKVEEGNYSFMANPGNYRLYAIPYLDVDWDHVFPVYMPSYYGNELRWEQSNLLNVDQTLQDIDISVTSSEVMNYGDGYISGQVKYSDEVIYIDSIFNLDWFEIGMLSNSDEYLASNITVILTDDQDRLIDYALTDADGGFVFKKVDFGTYYLYTEKAGIIENFMSVTISETNDSVQGLDFILYPYFGPITIPENFDIAENINFAYPNPFNDVLNINLFEFDVDEIVIEIVNLSGSVIKREERKNIINTNVIHVNTSDLESGIYFARIIIDNKIKTLKVLK